MSGIVREVTIGDCRLIQGDCLEVLPTLDVPEYVIVTDPPYGVHLGTLARNQKTLERAEYIGYADTPENLERLIAESWPLMQPAKRVVLTPGVRNLRKWPEPTHTGSFYYPSASGCNAWGFSCWQPILFYGKDPFAGLGSRPDSMQSVECAEPNGHPCPKPVKQWRWLIDRVAETTDSILDPFMGSGTGGVICAKTGRAFVGIEQSEEYFDIACRRIEQAHAEQGLFTGAMA